MRHFWAPQEPPPPRLRVVEALPIALLLAHACCWWCAAEPALRYMRATADALHQPQRYIDAVHVGAAGAPPPARASRRPPGGPP